MIPRLVRRATGLLLLAATLAMLLWATAFRVGGGEWARVETPSMGTVAPVGSLLWVEPVDVDDLVPGDFISFHPPGRADVTYSHLVDVRHADGTIGTTGVISGADPWRLQQRDVAGEVVRVWRGAGWLFQAAPLLLLGAAIAGLLVRFSPSEARVPAAVLAASLVLTTVLVVYEPLVGAEQLAFEPVDGGARATYVSTGLLPVEVSTADGAEVVLSPGEVGSVVAAHPDGEHRYRIDVAPRLPAWFWWALILGCFTPAVVTTIVGVPARVEPAAAGA